MFAGMDKARAAIVEPEAPLLALIAEADPPIPRTADLGAGVPSD